MKKKFENMNIIAQMLAEFQTVNCLSHQLQLTFVEITMPAKFTEEGKSQL